MNPGSVLTSLLGLLTNAPTYIKEAEAVGEVAYEEVKHIEDLLTTTDVGKMINDKFAKWFGHAIVTTPAGSAVTVVPTSTTPAAK
jgi:hypothetical protein